MKRQELIGKTIPDHKDPSSRKAIKLVDIRNDNTLEEIKQMPLLGFVYTLMIKCPYCRSEGIAQIFATKLQQEPDHKILCAYCNEPIVMRVGQALYFDAHYKDK